MPRRCVGADRADSRSHKGFTGTRGFGRWRALMWEAWSPQHSLQWSAGRTPDLFLRPASCVVRAGFCTFNGIAIAAKQALRRGAKRVLIIDLDAHGSGRTHSLIAGDDRIEQLDIAVNAYESYTVRRPTSTTLFVTREATCPHCACGSRRFCRGVSAPAHLARPIQDGDEPRRQERPGLAIV